jgi:gliding motility-associated-like protein
MSKINRIRLIGRHAFFLLFAWLFLLSDSGYAQSCVITPNFNFTVAPGCGVPRLVTFTNTSTGTNANNLAYYLWRVNGVVVDSTFGTAPNGTYMLPGAGTYTFSVVARRIGSACSNTNTKAPFVFSSNAPRVNDGNSVPSFTPAFTNCITNPLNPDDTFEVFLSSPDTLKSYRIIWGDGSTDDTGLELLPGVQILHRYHNLGVYTLKVATVNGGCNDTIIGIVRNLRPPNTSILPIPGGTYVGCAPLTITYRDSSLYALPGTTLTWDFGVPGGVFVRNHTRSNDTIQFTYPLSSALATCPKSISLTISNPFCGLPITNTKSGEVQVFNKSAAAIGIPSPLCNPSLTYTFTNTSTNNCVGGDRYFWRTVDTTIGWTTSKGPVTITFPSLGNQNITLIDSNTCGVDSITQTIFLNRPPAAGFTTVPKIGCTPLTVTFTDTSLGLNLTRAWTFSGTAPGTANTASVVRTYNSPGVFPMQLTVSNACTPASTARDTIRVFTIPTAGISGAVNGCVPHKVKFNNTTVNARPSAQYFWDFGNGDTAMRANPDSVTYTTPGSYTIQLVVVDTCGSDTETVVVNVSTIPTAAFTSSSACRGDSTVFTDVSSLAMGDVITTYRWYFGTGDSSTLPAPKYKYPTAGSFNAVLSITTDKNCVDFDTAVVTVQVSPDVSYTFTPSSICDGQQVSFDATATTSSGTITSVKWKFTPLDSAIVSEDTVFNFPSAATFPVTFSATNSIGCRTDTTRNVVIRPNPDSKPTGINVCIGVPTVFTDSSTIAGAGNSITQWQWDFNDDGITDNTSQNPTFTFPSAGTFKVKLLAGSNHNCFNLDSVNVIVHPRPVAAIGQSHSERCKLDSFTFSNTTTGGSTYRWNFGNSDTLLTPSLANFNYAYNDSGTFQVRMIAVTAFGCTDTAFLNAISRPFPEASFTVNDSLGCAPKLFTFNNTSVLSNTYQWFVGNTLSHTITTRPDTNIVASGQFVPIKLVAQNSFGCRPDTAVTNLQTFSNPVPNFTISQDSGCGPMPVAFTNTSTGGILFSWNLGNGTTANTANAASIYTASAINDSVYTIKLIASNGPGCSDSISKQIKVFPNPVAAFTPNHTDGCGPLAVTFTNSSVHHFGGNIDDLVHQWSFGNGGNAGTKNTGTTYIASLLQDSVYTAKLVVTSKFGCKDSTQQTIRVYPNPTANFTRSVTQGCGPLAVNFFNTSVPNDTGSIAIMSFQWNFANGNTSTAVNPSQTFLSNAVKDTSYVVKLIAFSEHGCSDSTTHNILVFPKPLSQFIISDTSGCSPHAVTFTNTSIPHDTGTINDMTFIWDLGNGFNSILQSPSATYFDRPLFDTTYPITLIAISEHNCRDTSAQQVRVHPKPIAGFTANQTQGCGPLPVQFTNTSLLGKFHSWRFGDGATDTATNPLHVFQNFPLVDTTFTTRFNTLSQFGCKSDTVNLNITTRFKPVADFSPSKDSICHNETVFFFNQSLGAISASWNFANGNTSTALNPNQVFAGLPATDTIYNVRLVVATPFSCRDTVIKPIRVTPPPQVNISTNVPALCKLDSFIFNNNTTNVANNRWIFNDGTPDLITASTAPFKKSFADSGTFTVQYIATSPNGCIANGSVNVISRPFPVANFVTNDTVACAPKSFTFTNTSQVANTYQWQIDNVPTHTIVTRPDTLVATAGQLFQVKLIAFNSFGCKPDTAIRSLRTIANPTPNFVLSKDSGCGPLVVNFTNSSSGATTFSWNFGNGNTSTVANPFSTFTPSLVTDTTYTIKLIAFNGPGCKDSISKSVKVHPTPAIDFTSDKVNGCGPLPVQFTNTSQHKTGGTINDMVFAWNFANGTLSTTKDPSANFIASFTKDTVYNVKLVGTTVFGCKDSVTKPIRVFPNATAAFSTNVIDGCGPLNVSLLNQSTPNDTGSISIMTFNWNFGNGNTSAVVNPSQTFVSNALKDTVYTIKLVAFSEHGCPDSTTKQVRVYPKPLAQFAASDTTGCGPLGVTFTNQSSPRDTGSIDMMTFFWDFGNGLNSIQKDAGTSYISNPLSDAVYIVKLIATSEHGCKDTTQDTIRAFPKPLVGFTSDKTQGCGPLNVQFTNTTQLGNTFNWIFDDGNTSAATNPLHTFQSYDLVDSLYRVRMFATSINGCRSDTALMNIVTRANPIAAFTPSVDSSCGNTIVLFNNQSQGGFNNAWNFGNGNTSTLVNPNTFYFASNQNDTQYQVRLVVTTGFGCRDTAFHSIKLFPIPFVNFTTSGSDGCGPLPVQFNNISQHKFGGTTSDMIFNWNLGNGVTSTTQSPNATYLASQVIDSVYNVKLTGTTKFGCKDSISKQIRVYPNATAQFATSVPDGCGPLNVQFINQSRPNDVGDISIMSFSWQFGNGNSSIATNVSQTFVSHPDKDTIYTIKLVAFSEHGCPDSTTKQIRVYPKPLAKFAVSDTAGCSPLAVNFINQSSPKDTGNIDMMTFFWDLGNNISSIQKDVTTLYNSNLLSIANYTPRLIATSEHGCRDTAQQLIRSFPRPIPAISANKTQGCGPLLVQFSNTTQLGNTYRWFFDDGDSSALQNPQHAFQSVDLFDSVYRVKMIATSALGCKADTAFLTIITRGNPIADFIPSDDSICGTGNITFFNTSMGGFNSSWNFGNGATSVALNPIQNFAARILNDTVYNVRLVITSPFQCRDTVIKPVKVNFLPGKQLNLVPPGCTPYSVQFTNTTQKAVRYEWDFGDGTTDTVQSPLKVFENPVALINRTYPVVMRAFTQSGCSDTVRRNVLVFPKPISDFNALKTNRCDTAEYQMLNSTLGASTYNWNFGNGHSSTGINPVTYFQTKSTADSLYQVRLISTTSNGCKDTMTKSVNVRPLVIADFTSNITNSCANLDVTFQNFSRNAHSYFWLFGDGSGASGSTPTKKYNNTGLYNVTLIAFDNAGCSDTMIRQNFVEVFEVPKANFLFNPPIVRLPNATVNFQDLSFISSGSITHFWDFGDNGATSLLQNPTHTFSDSSNYVVKLVVTSDKGCRDTLEKPFRVNPHKPIADFLYDPPEGCTPLTVQFNNISQFADDFLWDFGDATQSSEQNPQHTYTIPNTYNVALIARGPGGDSIVIKTGIITVRPLPRANFFVTPLTLVLPQATVTLTDLSFDATQWKWRISDEFNNPIFTSTQPSPQFAFQNPGEYSVQLIVENQFGCKDTAERSRLVNVIRDGKINVPNAFTPNGDGINERFRPVLSGVLSQDYVFMVFNRWGEKLFETNDINGSWDGMFNGQPSQTDVYVWVVEGLLEGNIKFTRSGNVTLLR